MGAGVLADRGSDPGRHFRIPGRRETYASKHCRGAVIAHADWSVGHLQAWQADLLIGANVEIVHPADQVNLFFES
jgi:hypothetical protein